MRLRIDKIWFIVVALVLSVPSAHAQIVTANPLEWMALAEGNEAINGEIEKEIKGQTKTACCRIPSPQSSPRYTNGRRSTTVI